MAWIIEKFKNGHKNGQNITEQPEPNADQTYLKLLMNLVKTKRYWEEDTGTTEDFNNLKKDIGNLLYKSKCKCSQ